MRTLTGNAAAQVALKQGSKPILILKISWGTGDVYYGDKTLTIGSGPGISVKGSINQITNLNIQQKEAKNQAEYNASSLASASVVLDDIDGSLKTLFNTQVIEHTKATLYQYFDGLVLADLVPLVTGVIMSPIVWSEGDRTLRVDIVSKLEDLNIPYASDGTDIPNIFPDAINKPFPFVFGNPINVPALKIKGSPKATLHDPLTSDNGPGSIIQINNGHLFPQGIAIDIVVGNAVFTGIFSGDDFTITVSNKPRYTAVGFAARVMTDPDNNNPKVGWLINSSINLVGLQCWLGSAHFGSSLGFPQLNYCWKQVGNKCFFINNWVAANGNNVLVSILNSDQFDEAAVLMRTSWGASKILWEYGFNWHYTTTFIAWWYNAGSQVFISGNPPGTPIADVHIVNQIPSTQVVDVVAFKKIEGVTGDMLLSIPSSYYTINLNDSLAVVNNGVPTTLRPTTITFPTPLAIIDPTWKDDQIYVSVKSSVGSNTADQIQYLIDNYTALTSDTVSFSTVHGYLAKYPSNFALLTVENVLKVVQEIAWQARCGIRIEGSTVSIVYLSKQPASLVTINDSLVRLKSLFISTSEIEQVFTHITGVWRDTYMSDDIIRRRRLQTTPSLKFQQTQGEEFLLVYSNNILKYGMRKLVYKFYIYNIQSLVQKSLNFWGHRLSNIFKEVKMTNYLNQLSIELFDAVTFGLTNATLVGSILGTVEEQTLNPDDWTIGMKIGLASLAGTMVQDASYWMDDSLDTLPTDPIASVSPTVYSNFIVTDLNGNSNNDQQGNSTGDIALGKITAVNSTTDFTVDIYDDGYGNAATKIGLDATLIGTSSNYQIGDKVIVHINNLGNFLHAGSGSSSVASAKVAWGQDVTVASAGAATLDTIPLVEGDIVLLFNQSSAANSKRWTVHTMAGSGSNAWTPLDQPDACIITHGAVWTGTRFTLTGVNAYTPSMDQFGVAYAVTHTNITNLTSGSITRTGALTSTQGGDGVAVPINNFLLVANQTIAAENGLYYVLSGVWIKIGQPSEITPQNGRVFKGIDFYLQAGNTYLPQFQGLLMVDLASTVSLGAQTGNTTVVDGATFTTGYILLKDEAPSTKRGVYFNYNDNLAWAYLGQLPIVKVKETPVTNGLLNYGRKYYLSSANNYTIMEQGDFCIAVALNTTASLPAALVASDGATISIGQKILHTGTTPGVYVCLSSGSYVLDKAYSCVVITTSAASKAQIYVNTGGGYQLSYASVHS